MHKNKSGSNGRLNLKAGDWVEVRSQEEILATLDESGKLEKLPFMPEMFKFCGKQLRVFKRADKTCDNIIGWSIRRMTNAVHLENTRCDGQDHGGCQAGCMVFWKEAWLKRIEKNTVRCETISLAPAVCTGTHGLCRLDSVSA